MNTIFTLYSKNGREAESEHLTFDDADEEAYRSRTYLPRIIEEKVCDERYAELVAQASDCEPEY